MTELTRLEGLPYGRRTHTYNSRLAQELALWGDGLDATNELHDALFRAYFVEGRNLADVDVLVSVAESCGLDGDDARAVVEERSFSSAIDAHWSASRRMGVTGVPTFVSAGYGVVGAQPYEVLEALVKRGGAVRRTGSAR